MLETRLLRASYGDFQALFGISLSVARGETIAIIGSNGAGKSTFLRSIAGLLRAPNDAIRFEGRPIGGMPPDKIVRLGIAMVPEGRRLFPSLTVQENLQIGAYARRPGAWTIARVLGLFPMLRERLMNPAATLSGGQQQMVAIGRALLANPKLLLCDEISLGLAPPAIRDVYRALLQITQAGTTVLLVEQDLDHALAAANRVYCFREGRIALEGRPSDLTRAQIAAAYFGA